MKLSNFYYSNSSFLLVIFWSILVGHLVFCSSTSNGSTSQQNPQNVSELERRCSSTPGLNNCHTAIKERNKLTIKQSLLTKLDLPESFKHSKFPKVPQKIIESYLRLMKTDSDESISLEMKRLLKASIYNSSKFLINMNKTVNFGDENNDDDDVVDDDAGENDYDNDDYNYNDENDGLKQLNGIRGAGFQGNGSINDENGEFFDFDASDNDNDNDDVIDDDRHHNNGHSDLDDYMFDSNELHPVPPKTIIVINKAHQKLRHKCSNKSDFFYFHASNSTRNYHVQKARLNFAVNLKHRQHNSTDQDVEFVFKIVKGCYRKTDNNYVPQQESSTTNTVVTNTSGPNIVHGILTVKKSLEFLKKSKWWVEIDITKWVSKWFRSSSNNNGLSLSIMEDNDLVEIQNSNEHKAFIIMDVKARKTKRSKRSSDLKCSESSRSRNCCRSPLTIDFDEFGWDFVLTPRRYEAYYCTGACPAAYKQMYTHTYVAQMSSAAIGPCCSPREYNNVSILYFDQDFNIRFSNLPGMVVAKCGCS